MNRSYRLVFNRKNHIWQAVAEFAKARVKSSGGASGTQVMLPKPNRLIICLASAFMTLGTHTMVYALPAGADVQYGQSTIHANGSQMQINQTTQQSIINWQSFGIAPSESVQLLQPVQGMALYRVVGSQASEIFGSLSATGSLFLINTNGVLFGQGAQVDVGSIVASTMNISNTDFLNGNYHFDANGSTAGVINQGTIRVTDGGYLVMLGREVNNGGSLVANKGSVVMGSAESATLDFYGNGLVKAKLSGDALNAVINQSGNIRADGGAVQVATSSRSSAVNVSGIVQANSLVDRNGVIRLEGSDNAKVSVSGTLNAAGNQEGTTGGRIEVTGEQVAIFNGAKLDASGNAGGGIALVGGDYQGKNTEVNNSRTTYVDQGVSINVSAKQNGDGGKAIVWADDTTRYYGSILATGGAQSGNGGFVEVSGKQNLAFAGAVDVGANFGLGGQVLLDPQDIVLNTSTQPNPTNNANGTPDIAFADLPLAGTTTIQIADITGFSELFLQATNNITVNNTLTMAANNSIRLEANNDINIGAAVTVSGTGSINFKADADYSGTGDLNIGGNLTARSGGMTLSAANINRTAGNLSTTGTTNENAGNITMTAQQNIDLGTATINARGGNASSGSSGNQGGTISINAASYTGTGAVNVSGTNGNGANTNGGSAGSLNLTTSDGMNLNAITASGGNAGSGNASSGNAGSISLSNTATGDITAGNLTARSGNATGTGTGGTTGSVLVSNSAAGGNIAIGNIATNGGNKGNGGAITVSTLTSLGGNIVTGVLNSSGGNAVSGSSGNNAGAISITSGGTYTGTTLTANGSNGSGVSQSGGHAANITISANSDITSTNINASGGSATNTNGDGGNAGTITISNSAGDITTGSITARTGNATGSGVGGAAGGIDLSNIGGTGISTGNISTQGNIMGHGGTVSISSTSAVSTGSINTSGGTALTGNAGRNAGNITLTASSFSATAITASGSNGSGTDQNGGHAATVDINTQNGLTLTGSITVNGGSGSNTDSSGGNAGNVNLLNTVSGDISIAAVSARTGAARGAGAGGSVGTISVSNNGGNISAGNITTQGNTMGHGGDITFNSAADITTGSLNSSGGSAQTGNAGRNAGNINITAPGNIIVSTITASGSNGSGTNQDGGNGGTVTLASGAGNNVTHTSINTRGGSRTGTGTGGNGGNITISGEALLSANTTVDARAGTGGITDGNITWSNSINSLTTNRTLAVNTSGITRFDGAIGNNLALTSLNINSGGSTQLNGGSVTTVNGQTYGDAVTLGAATSLNTTDSNITFSNQINAAGNTLTTNTGAGSITATNASNDFANVAITSANNVNLRDTNSIELGASNIAGNYTLRTNGIITQNAGVTVGGTTMLNAGAPNNVILDNPANNFNSVTITSARDVSLVDANAMTVGASNVRMLTAQTLTDDFTLAGNITATGMGSGTSVNLVSAQNFINSGNRTIAPGTGSRWLIYSANPTADIHGANLLSAYNFKQYNTAFGDSILGTGNGFIYTVAPIITTALTGTASKVYDSNTTAAIGSLVRGQSGAIDGDTVNLTAFTSATYDNKNVGTGKTVSSNVFSISSATNGGKQVFGYQLATNTASGNVGTVTPAALTITGDTTSNVYTATTQTNTFSTSGLLGGDTVTGVSGLGTGTNAGTYNDNLSAASGTGIGNYTISYLNGSHMITQRPITITADSGQSKTVGTLDPTLTYAIDGMGLGGGDTLVGALSRNPGETVGNYAINQGTLTAGSNYMVSYIGDLFAILAPSTTPGAGGLSGTPSDLAGLGNLLIPTDSQVQNLAILNVGAPAAGSDTDIENATETCETDQNPRLSNPNTSIILNFGMQLPKGVKPRCV